MCQTPTRIYLPDGKDTRAELVPCRVCWQCKANRINDYVGRCIAESKTSTKTLAVTLTYRGDVVNAAVLVYSDVQKMLKRLRFDGHSVRYIVAGEYGSKKGRAHWHIILFFKGKFPQVEMDSRIEWKYWTHGLSYFQDPDYGGFQYLLKYIQKNREQRVEIGHFALSKKPPLGTEWLREWAESHVRQKVPMRKPEYSFSDQFDNKGRRRKFWLAGKARQDVIDYYRNAYQERYGIQPPWSEFIEAHEDRETREEQSEHLSLEGWRARVEQQRKKAEKRARNEARRERAKNPIKALHKLGQADVILQEHEDGTLTLNDEGKLWHVETDGELAAALHLSGQAEYGTREARQARLAAQALIEARQQQLRFDNQR